MTVEEINKIIDKFEEPNDLPSIERVTGKSNVVAVFKEAQLMYKHLLSKAEEMYEIGDVTIENAFYDKYPNDWNNPIPDVIYEDVLKAIEEELKNYNVYSNEVMQQIEDSIYKYNLVEQIKE